METTSSGPARASRMPRPRRLGWSDRRRLERAGWRTLLEYGEDHVRSADGTLLAVRRRWIAEAEHVSGRLMVCEVVDEQPDVAWARLQREATRLSAGYSDTSSRYAPSTST